MNNRRTNTPSRSPRVAPEPARHTSTWRGALTLLAALAIVATSCGSSDEQVVDAAAEQASSSEISDAAENGPTAAEATAAPVATPTPAPPEPTATPEQATPEPPEPTTPPEPEETAEAGSDLTFTGSHSFDFTMLCNLPDLIPDPAVEACETSGDLTYLPVLIQGTRTGTLTGTDFVAATFVVWPDYTYQFAGPGKFVGTVEGCGEGTVVYTVYGFGQLGTPTDYHEVLYTFPAESSLSTVAVSVAAEQTASGPTGRQVSGTYSCDETSGELPDAGVDPATAHEMYGPSFAAYVPLCTFGTPLGSGNGTCATDGEHEFQTLRNKVQFTGSWQGIGTFIGTNIVSVDGFYEESGMFLFEGTVEGCGDGTVILVNEAAGRQGLDLTYHRGYTPTFADTGTLGLRNNQTAVPTGPGGFDGQGTYSC